MCTVFPARPCRDTEALSPDKLNILYKISLNTSSIFLKIWLGCRAKSIGHDSCNMVCTPLSLPDTVSGVKFPFIVPSNKCRRDALPGDTSAQASQVFDDLVVFVWPAGSSTTNTNKFDRLPCFARINFSLRATSLCILGMFQGSYIYRPKLFQTLSALR